MQSRFLFVRTPTFFGFLISHAYFRVFCWFRCSFLLRCLQPQNMSFFWWKNHIFGQAHDWKNGYRNQTFASKRCEISLQHPPYNSHIYNQLAPSSQIREKWATFICVCLTTYYNNIPKINIHLSNFQSAKALTLCPYLHALVPLLHVNSRTNYCSQQPYFNVLTEKLRFFTLSRASNIRFLHIACLYFSLFPTFSTPVFLSFFRTKKITSLHRHALFGKNRIVEQQMNELRLIVPPCTIRVFARVNFRKFCLSLQVNF